MYCDVFRTPVNSLTPVFVVMWWRLSSASQLPYTGLCCCVVTSFQRQSTPLYRSLLLCCDVFPAPVNSLTPVFVVVLWRLSSASQLPHSGLCCCVVTSFQRQSTPSLRSLLLCCDVFAAPVNSLTPVFVVVLWRLSSASQLPHSGLCCCVVTSLQRQSTPLLLSLLLCCDVFPAPVNSLTPVFVVVLWRLSSASQLPYTGLCCCVVTSFER